MSIDAYSTTAQTPLAANITDSYAHKMACAT